MSHREQLINLIKGKQGSKSETRRIINKYLYKNYDSMLVKAKTEEILDGNVDDITDEEVVELIRVLDADAQIEEVKQQPKVTGTAMEALNDAYGIMLEENNKLRKSNDKKDEVIKELQTDRDNLLKRMNKMEKIIQSFKVDITKIAELVEIEDEELNELYMSFMNDGTTTINNAILFETNSSTIIPKSYYKINKRETR